MKHIFRAALIGFITIITACATIAPHQKAGVEIGKIYKFSNPKSDYSLYVKFLPKEDKNSPLLFTTLLNKVAITDINEGENDVIKQDWFIVGSDSKVIFRYSEDIPFAEIRKKHKYFSSGSEHNGKSSISYKLDFSQATVLN